MEPLFNIDSAISKGQYKSHLYKMTFLKDSKTMPIIIFLCLLGGSLLNSAKKPYSIAQIFLYATGIFVVTMIILIRQIDKKINSSLNNIRFSDFNQINNFKFYEDKLVISKSISKESVIYPYLKMYSIVENSSFFAIYLKKDKVAFINKRDISNLNEFREFIRKVMENKIKVNHY